MELFFPVQVFQYCCLINFTPQACINTTRASLSEKRVKREPAAVVLREALMKGKWLW